MFDDGRRADLEHIERRLRAAKTPHERRVLADLTHSIVKESRQTRETRQRLVEATKANDTTSILRLQHQLKGETQE